MPVYEPTQLAPPLQELFANWIDYAGSFPPASLPTDQVATQLISALNSQHNWFVNRVVLNYDEILTFDSTLAASHSLDSSRRIPLCAVVGEQWQVAMTRLNEIAPELRATQVTAIEGKWTESNLPPELLENHNGSTIYVELPIDDELENRLRFLRDAKLCAKLRAGGTRSELFPAVKAVVEFLSGCRRIGLPYKLTAGLHHLWADQYCMTYATDSPKTIMHGFLQVALAALALETDANSIDVATEILKSTSAAHVSITSTGIGWRDQSWSLADFQSLRQNRLHAIGSCSIDEPLDELLKFDHDLSRPDSQRTSAESC